MANLSDAQLLTLKNDITVTRAAVLYNGSTLLDLWNGGANSELADFYNQVEAPAVKVWLPTVSVVDLLNAVEMAEFLALTVSKQNGWFAMTQPGTVDATLSRVRQNFIDIFGIGANTTANLTAISQRDGTYGEVLFSVDGGAPGSGNVSDIIGQSISSLNISEARDV